MTIFLTDLDYDQYNEAHNIIFGSWAQYKGEISDLTSHNMEVHFQCQEEFEKCLVALSNEDIPFEY